MVSPFRNVLSKLYFRTYFMCNSRYTSVIDASSIYHRIALLVELSVYSISFVGMLLFVRVPKNNVGLWSDRREKKVIVEHGNYCRHRRSLSWIMTKKVYNSKLFNVLYQSLLVCDDISPKNNGIKFSLVSYLYLQR